MTRKEFLNHPTSVLTAYGRPSITKVSIESNILGIMSAENGYSYRVLSHNCFHFTCGYLVDKISNETGELLYTEIHIFTPSKWNQVFTLEEN